MFHYQSWIDKFIILSYYEYRISEHAACPEKSEKKIDDSVKTTGPTLQSPLKASQWLSNVRYLEIRMAVNHRPESPIYFF